MLILFILNSHSTDGKMMLALSLPTAFLLVVVAVSLFCGVVFFSLGFCCLGGGYLLECLGCFC